jgi:hypothetical protein
MFSISGILKQMYRIGRRETRRFYGKIRATPFHPKIAKS